MKKNFSILVLGLIVVLGACGKKSSNNTTTNPYGYQQPQYGPPNLNWQGAGSGYIPPGNCGQVSQLPSDCYGAYQGYSYCGNQWFYQQTQNMVWTFPAFGSCGNTGGGGFDDDDDNWWDDYEPIDDDDDDVIVSDSDDDDDDGGNPHDGHDHDEDEECDEVTYGSYNSGWKKMWGTMGSSENRYITIVAPKTGTYHISFKGNYTGKNQSKERLATKFSGGNTHTIKDLNQTHKGSGEKTESCKVYVNFNLKKGDTYKVYLSGSEDSVNETYVRVTNFWPSDVSKLCN